MPECGADKAFVVEAPNGARWVVEEWNCRRIDACWCVGKLHGCLSLELAECPVPKQMRDTFLIGAAKSES